VLKINDAMIQSLYDFVSTGYTISAACAKNKISRVTYYDWIRRGKADTDINEQTLYRQLVERMEGAEALHEQTHLTTIQAASVNTWQAAAWLLERRYPERYAKRVVPQEYEARDTLIEIG